MLGAKDACRMMCAGSWSNTYLYLCAKTYSKSPLHDLSLITDSQTDCCIFYLLTMIYYDDDKQALEKQIILTKLKQLQIVSAAGQEMKYGKDEQREYL